jgi:3-oxoadipate enol-lactonase
MPNVRIDSGINLYYQISGEGYPVILISGLGADHTAWDFVIPYLQNSYQVIRFDNRGAGRSDAPEQPYTTEMMAADVLELMNALQIKKTHIIGHSMGGAIAQHIALSAPDIINKLILINSFSKINSVAHYTIVGRLRMAELDIPLKTKIETNLSWLYSNRSLQNTNQVKNIFDRIGKNPHPQSVLGFKNQVFACLQHNSQKKIDQINNPTLILSASQDILITIDHSLKLLKIPNSKLNKIPGAHMAIIENPFKTSKAILNHLST